MATLIHFHTHICRPCLRRLASQSPRKRDLTTTPARRKHGALPTFHPTSSPELDALLNTFRTNIFLPSHLIHAQRSLLYRPKNYPLLTNPDEPATVRLGPEVHQLHPLNHLRDEPPTRPSFAKILDLMTESAEWKNLPGFLEGLQTAGRRVGAGQLEKMVRRANSAGRQGVVMECLRRVEGTGVRLGDDAGLVREVMLGAVMRAQAGKWEMEAVDGAARYARGVWDLLWDERHRGGKTGGLDMRKAPEVAGIVVEMEAARAVKGGGEGKGELEGWVQRLLGVWEKGDRGLVDGDWSDANQKLLRWAPVWQGMVLARRVLGEESRLGKELRERVEEDLEPMLKKAREIVAANAPEKGVRRGMKMYEQLMLEGFL